jgi:tRNA nucleotidyltransferase (CCA-adding enzyme)
MIGKKMRAYDLNEEVKRKIKTPEFQALLTPSLQKLSRLYKTNGYDLRIVGGAVRDLMLGKDPKDIDLASDATPQESMGMLKDAGIKVIETGLEHGTITAVVDGEEFEITTLRVDVETDGRHAEVEFTKDWEIDAERRDLTFNAMSLELDGTLHDYFGGIDDLKAGVAKFVGDSDKRIQEDYLRILRYFRFQGRTPTPNFDKETLDAIERNAAGLQKISGERIWMETAKILSGNHAMAILDKIKDTGVDLYINLPAYDPSIVERTRKNTDNPVVILASMMQNDAQALDIASKWKMSAYDRDLMRFIVANKNQRFTVKEAKRMWTNPKIKNEYVVELARYFGKDALVTELQNWKTPIFPVTGQLLMQAGLKAGPQMGEILRKLEKEWKDSGYEKEWSSDELKEIVGAETE